ncbi:MAG: ATP-binding protein [Pirellulales bacterium]
MSTAHPDLMEFLTQHRLAPPSGAGGRRMVERAKELLAKLSGNPHELVADMVRVEAQRDQAQANCAKCKEAAENLQKLLESLVNSNAEAYRCEGLIETATGPRVICRQGERVRELSVHPDVSLDVLRGVQPWEYVRVHENVVVGAWVGDPTLLENALGEVVTFQGYAGQNSLARVTRIGSGEEIVRLAPSLVRQPIPPHAKLVLMRDNPRWAIACLPGQQSTSRFEVPIGLISDRLSDLAGIEPLAEKLLLEVVKRILQPEIRAAFNLDPLRGILLCSEKPGMGKTAFMRAFAGTLHDIGQHRGFEVALYLVKPNEFKSMWHGEDARIVREELFGALRARRELPRTQMLIQLVVMDEIDSLGRRPEARDSIVSSAQSDALETFLVEMDGMVQQAEVDPPAHLFVVGMTNRPERIDDAIKRPGRLGDEVIEIADLDVGGAEQVCLVYARAPELPWFVDEEVRTGLPLEDVARRFLRPALHAVFNAVILRYMNDTQKKFDVTAGQVLSSAHYRKAMNVAKNRAANRRLRNVGVPGIAYEDVVEGLLDTAVSVAQQMQADPHMLIRHLKIKIPVVRVEAVPRGELQDHRFARSVH